MGHFFNKTNKRLIQNREFWKEQTYTEISEYHKTFVGVIEGHNFEVYLLKLELMFQTIIQSHHNKKLFS